MGLATVEAGWLPDRLKSDFVFICKSSAINGSLGSKDPAVKDPGSGMNVIKGLGWFGLGFCGGFFLS